MKRTAVGTLIGLAAVFAVNGAVLWLGGLFSPSDRIALAIGSAIAALVALRIWSRPEMSAHSSAWWLAVAMGAALVGAFSFWVDVRLGYIQLPLQPEGGILASIENPLAVMVSITFLPLFASIAVGSAVRAAIAGAAR